MSPSNKNENYYIKHRYLYESHIKQFLFYSLFFVFFLVHVLYVLVPSPPPYAYRNQHQGRIQDFKLGGTHLKKLGRAEEGANILGVFRVKNHYFTPKNHSFYNHGGRREKCWGISCEKSRFYAKKTYFFSNFRGGACRVRPPLDPPLNMAAESIRHGTKTKTWTGQLI